MLGGECRVPPNPELAAGWGGQPGDCPSWMPKRSFAASSEARSLHPSEMGWKLPLSEKLIPEGRHAAKARGA